MKTQEEKVASAQVVYSPTQPNYVTTDNKRFFGEDNAMLHQMKINRKEKRAKKCH